MKKLMIITCALLMNFFDALSQVSVYFKTGVSPGSTPEQRGIIVNRNNPHSEFTFNLLQMKTQFSGGVGAHLALRTPFFLEGGVAYSQQTSLYQINYRMPTELNARQDVMNETEKSILLPVNIGVSLGSIDVTSGWTALKTISKPGELSHLEGFAEEKNPIRMAWQMGLRYAFKRALFGVEYQGTLHRIGQGMSVNHQSLELMNVPGKMVFSFQFGF